MAFFTYLIAFGHFSSELLIYRSAKVNPGVISPVIVSSESDLILAGNTSPDSFSATSLIWMFMQYDFYTRS